MYTMVYYGILYITKPLKNEHSMLVFFNKIQEVTMLIMVIRNKTPTYLFY